MKDWQTKLLDDLKAKYGDVPPYWVVYPTYHPYSMGWRMGGGESCRDAWQAWWQAQDWAFDEKVTYFKKFGVPHAWLEALIATLYEIDCYDCEESELQPYFEKLQALGFGGYDDWRADIEDDDKWS